MSWEIDENTNFGRRHMPTGDFLKLEKGCLLIYAYFQLKSYRGDGYGLDEVGEKHRYLRVEDLNKKDCYRTTRVSRTTIDKKIEILEQTGLIRRQTYNGKEYYMLDVQDYYTLVDFKMSFMKAILRRCDDVLLRMFLWHKSYHEWLKRTKPGTKQYYVSKDKICENLGIPVNPYNLERIKDANDILVGFEVISIEKKYIKKGHNTQQQNWYTYLK